MVLTLKMEAALTSETNWYPTTTLQHYSLEELDLSSHYRENLKSCYITGL